MNKEPQPDQPHTSQTNTEKLLGFQQRSPVGFALAMLAVMGIAALVLALLFGFRPLFAVSISLNHFLLSLLATALLVAFMGSLMFANWRWIQKLEALVNELIANLFREVKPGAVFLVALMAGICEELLFRGVIQTGLSGLLGPTAALLIASLLFGLAHAVNLAYFSLASLVGLYLGALYLWTGNLLVPILVHFLYDWIILHWVLARIRKHG